LRHFKLIENIGLDKPIQIVQLGATDTEIVNMAALAAFGVGG
jgi:malate dehydrogenase (oxaloacetate-decarboxylating)(NADP+)